MDRAIDFGKMKGLAPAIVRDAATWEVLMLGFVNREAWERTLACELTTITPLEMIGSLESFSGAFLYTHIDTEGLMQGIPMAAVRSLRASTPKPLIVAGGIATSEQLDQLDAMKIDAVVGMAIYTGKVKLAGPASGAGPHPNITREFD